MREFIEIKTLREFGLIVGLGLPIIFGFLIPFIYGHNFRIWFLFLAFPLIFLAIFNPKTLLYPYKSWISIGTFLGKINSTLLLGLVYLFVLIPIALIMKIFKYDPLRKKRINAGTYLENNKKHKIDLTKIF